MRALQHLLGPVLVPALVLVLHSTSGYGIASNIGCFAIAGAIASRSHWPLGCCLLVSHCSATSTSGAGEWSKTVIVPVEWVSLAPGLVTRCLSHCTVKLDLDC